VAALKGVDKLQRYQFSGAFVNPALMPGTPVKEPLGIAFLTVGGVPDVTGAGRLADLPALSTTAMSECGEWTSRYSCRSP